MRYALVFLAVLATGCAKTGCDLCQDPDLEDQCRDSVRVCSLLGPAALVLGADCKESAYAICENNDTSETDAF